MQNRRHHHGLCIGGCEFLVSSEIPVVNNYHEDIYAPFRGATCKEDIDICIRAELTRGVCTNLSRMRVLFDANRSWSVLTGGKSRVIVHAPRGLESAVWAASFESGMNHVSVACSDSLYHGTDIYAHVESPLHYPLDQVLLMYAMDGETGIIVHAAGMIVNQQSYIFVGQSGAGKSTLMSLMTESEMGNIMSDDRIVVRRREGAMIGYGSPWPGDARIARPTRAPIAACLFLEHAAHNSITANSKTEALRALLPVSSILWHEKHLVEPALAVCERIVSTIPCYSFKFTPDQSAIEMFREFVS